MLMNQGAGKEPPSSVPKSQLTMVDGLVARYLRDTLGGDFEKFCKPAKLAPPALFTVFEVVTVCLHEYFTIEPKCLNLGLSP